MTKHAEIDPSCSIFDSQDDLRIVELGSGTGIVGVHLAKLLSSALAHTEDRPSRKTRLILTDLIDVCPLIEDTLAQSFPDELLSWRTEGSHDVDIRVMPLPWGDAEKARELSCFLGGKEDTTGPSVTHIICSDLVSNLIDCPMTAR